MNREQYFKDKMWAMLAILAMQMLSLFTMDDASVAWQIIVPTFFFLINLGIVIYGFIKYDNND